jgi:hypothetical protein
MRVHQCRADSTLRACQSIGTLFFVHACSLSLFACMSVCLSVSLSLFQSLSLSLSLRMSLSLMYVCLSVSVTVFVYASLCSSLSVSESVLLCVSHSVSLSLSLSPLFHSPREVTARTLCHAVSQHQQSIYFSIILCPAPSSSLFPSQLTLIELFHLQSYSYSLFYSLEQ